VSAPHDSMPIDTPNLSAAVGTTDHETESSRTRDSLISPPAPTLVDVTVRSAAPIAVGQGQERTERPHGHSSRVSPARNGSVRRWSGSMSWPLLVILAAQVGLSARLVWSNTAFQDEALYLRAGHLEWAHWLHRAPIPDFPSYFSGAPVIYPPLGALADSVGGLAAARIVSLCFMLGVTSLLWATAHRLYGQRAALLASALFATLAGTQFLGAFATFDAMALFLLALATWLGVRAVDSQDPARIALLTASGAVLAAADAVKYATALFTPVVVVVVALATWRGRGARAGLTGGLAVLGSWLILILAGVFAGGRDYWLGITTSTLDRPQSDVALTVVLQRAYVWTSLILVLAVLGAVLATRSEARGRLLPAALAVAAFLAPAEQARLHTTVSLQKHVVFGAWFAAIAAGYAMARISRVDPGHGWAAVMALPIAASTLFGSMGQAASLYKVWPNSAGVIGVLRSAVSSHPGNYLAEDYDVEAYYLRREVPWQRWSNTYYFSYLGALPGAPSYAAAISNHYFSLVILDFGDTAATDREITRDLRHAGGYNILARSGQFTVWALSRPASAGKGGGLRVSH
jgi:4-amino-4-deoxy-L-arabinose transferase-like glycosyltransferase